MKLGRKLFVIAKVVGQMLDLPLIDQFSLLTIKEGNLFLATPPP